MSNGEQQQPPESAKQRERQKYAAAVFGVIFVTAILVLAIVFPEPTAFQYTVFRIVLALAAGGVAAMIPGFIQLQMGSWLRAGGAIAVFALVYFYNPAQLVVPPPEEDDPLVYAIAGASLWNETYPADIPLSSTYYLEADCGQGPVRTSRFFKGVFFLAPDSEARMTHSVDRAAVFDDLFAYLKNSSDGLDDDEARRKVAEWTARDTTVVCPGMESGQTVDLAVGLRSGSGDSLLTPRQTFRLTGELPAQGLILER